MRTKIINFVEKNSAKSTVKLYADGDLTATIFHADNVETSFISLLSQNHVAVKKAGKYVYFWCNEFVEKYSDDENNFWCNEFVGKYSER